MKTELSSEVHKKLCNFELNPKFVHFQKKIIFANFYITVFALFSAKFA